MYIHFKNAQTKQNLFSKKSEQVPPLPANGQAFRLDDGRVARVVDIEYFLSKEPQFSYDKIEVLLEVYEKEVVSAN